jgi:hypothetical protein
VQKRSVVRLHVDIWICSIILYVLPNFNAHRFIMQLCEWKRGKKWRFGAFAYSKCLSCTFNMDVFYTATTTNEVEFKSKNTDRCAMFYDITRFIYLEVY